MASAEPDRPPMEGAAVSRVLPPSPGGIGVAELAAWARKELVEDILPYWTRYGRDSAGEGFYGSIGVDNRPDPAVDRSVVMVARHLWTFSAAARSLGDPTLRRVADEAYGYLLRRFRDVEYGGFFWAVTPEGSPSVAKKQIYGQAFAVYGLAEYARCPDLDPAIRAEALALAEGTFALLELHARDRTFGGYREALGNDWSSIDDRTLSDVDLNCDKSMNTNLHLLEAYANLYRAAPTPELREAIVALLDVHARCIVQADGHLGLFFRDDWSRMDRVVSYGHDVEASWLLEEALEALVGGRSLGPGAAADRRAGSPSVAAGPPSDKVSRFRLSGAAIREGGPPGGEAAGAGRSPTAEAGVFDSVRRACATLAAATLAEGLDGRLGGLADEAEDSRPGASRSDRRIWWCQAEALVGFVAAWERTRASRWLDAALSVRDFIRDRLLDTEGGEWRWGTDAAGRPLPGYPKGGNWKTGYHDGRACMELMRRAVTYAEVH